MSDDKVGYCKPPKENQFQKGQSGCPDGGWKQRRENQRKRKQKEKADYKNAAALLKASLDKVVQVRVDGEPTDMTNLELIFSTLTQDARKDDKARRSLFSVAKLLGILTPEPAKLSTGVVVVRAPAVTEEEFSKRAAAMAPLPLNPLEDLPGITPEMLARRPKRAQTPDDEED